MLKTVGMPELISRGYYEILRAKRKGKKSRRVTLLLSATELPPPSLGLQWTVVNSPFGNVRLRAWFNQTLGRWGVTLVFQFPEEGFKVADHVAST
jgi:hypothetical protein